MNKQIIKSNKPKIIFIMGPTASGKTTLAKALHQKLPVEIISVDSTLIYRGMDIGTAKPTLKERQVAPHRLIDILDPLESYSVAKFCRDALIEIEKIIALGRIPLLVGGTIFYFKALLDGLSPLPSADFMIRTKIKMQAKKYGWKLIYKYLQEVDPISAARIHYNDFQRLSRAMEVFLISGKSLTELTKKNIKQNLPYDVLQLTTSLQDREVLYQRIKIRFLQMLNLGFEDEVGALYVRGDLHKDLPAIRSVGYRQMWSYLSGEIKYDEMIYRSVCATRQLAKHQITWLKKWKNVHMIETNNINSVLNTILYFIRM